MSGGVFSCCVHSHSTLCDGRNSLEEMASAAFSAGIKHMGFSGHVHTPIDYDEGNVLPMGGEEYRSRCAEMKKLYAGKMEILCGLEWDLCSDEPVWDGLDYWIGSVHNLRDSRSGKYYSIDWNREMFRSCRDEAFGGDSLAVVKAYYDEVARVAEMKPDVLGHIDLITKLNGDGGLFDEKSREYTEAALRALEHADPETTLMEINTGAVARGYRSEVYPAQFLLRRWRDMGGRVIISSDAHSCDKLLFGYEMAVEAAKAAGYRSCAIITAAGISEVEL